MNLAKKIRRIGLADKLLDGFISEHPHAIGTAKNVNEVSIKSLRNYLEGRIKPPMYKIYDSALAGATVGVLFSSLSLGALALWEFLRHGMLETDIWDMLMAGGGLTALCTAFTTAGEFYDHKNEGQEIRENFLTYVVALKQREGFTGVNPEYWPELDAYYSLAKSYFREKRYAGMRPDLYDKLVLNRE